METRRIKTVDLKFREFLKNLAEAYFKDKLYPIDQTKINIELLIANQIDYKDYVSGAKGALKRFLELFPDIFLLEDRNINGGTQVYCTLNAPSIAKIERSNSFLLLTKTFFSIISKLSPSILFILSEDILPIISSL